jgi:hypothetical protein
VSEPKIDPALETVLDAIREDVARAKRVKRRQEVHAVIVIQDGKVIEASEVSPAKRHPLSEKAS